MRTGSLIFHERLTPPVWIASSCEGAYSSCSPGRSLSSDAAFSFKSDECRLPCLPTGEDSEDTGTMCWSADIPGRCRECDKVGRVGWVSEGSEKAGCYVNFYLISEGTSITPRMFRPAKYAMNGANLGRPQENRLRVSSFRSAKDSAENWAWFVTNKAARAQTEVQVQTLSASATFFFPKNYQRWGLTRRAYMQSEEIWK